MKSVITPPSTFIVCIIFHGPLMYLSAQNEDSSDEDYDYDMANKCVLFDRSGQFYFSSAKGTFVSRRLQWNPSLAQ